MMGGIGGMVLTGMAFGAGSAIAHEAVRGVMGSGRIHLFKNADLSLLNIIIDG